MPVAITKDARTISLTDAREERIPLDSDPVRQVTSGVSNPVIKLGFNQFLLVFAIAVLRR